MTIILISLFLLALLIVYTLPTFYVRLKASTLGLKLDFKQAKIIVRDHCVKNDFLTGVKEIWKIIPIPIETLTLHYLAGGSLSNLKNGINEMKNRNADVNFQALITFDLAGRDLIEEVKKAETRNWKFEF